MKKNWKALTAVAAVILTVAVAAILINLRPTPAPEPTPDALQATGKFGFPTSDIKIGEGGTKKASDGKTITGYNGTCNSAVQAAANYAPLMRDVNPRTWAEQKKTLAAVSKPGPWFQTATLGGEIIAGAKDLPPGFDGGWYDKTEVAAGGMYRMASCEEKERAVVQVFIGSLNARTNTAPLASFGTVSLELSWDGDWKITDALVLNEDRDFGGKVKDKGPSGPNPEGPTGSIPTLTTALVDRLFDGKSKEGWIEYANAKR
jgi:hypothetical protein